MSVTSASSGGASVVSADSAAATAATVAPVLSVVIVSWNTRQLLDDCLCSLYAGGLNGLQGRADVTVVDNASGDGSADLVRDRYPDVQLVTNRENVGFARANNQVLQTATARYLLLLNSDTVVPAGALAQLVATMDANPHAGVCSPLLLNGDGSPQICWARFQTLQSELRGSLDRSQSPYPLADFADPDARAQMEPFHADWVGGACFLVRRAAMRQVGLLDENFFMYSEETDWCRRFARAGWHTLLVPSVTVTHLGGGSSRAVPGATRTRIWRSHLRLYRLLYGPIGGLLPQAAATARYGLFWVKRRARNSVPTVNTPSPVAFAQAPTPGPSPVPGEGSLTPESVAGSDDSVEIRTPLSRNGGGAGGGGLREEAGGGSKP